MANAVSAVMIDENHIDDRQRKSSSQSSTIQVELKNGMKLILFISIILRMGD
jgi:hypothetical protein